MHRFSLRLLFAFVSCAAFGISALEYVPRAAVFGEQASAYPGEVQQAVEMLRFVTAYRTGLDSIVDVTPYSPMLKALAAEAGELEFYSRIDTWVGNSTAGAPVLHMNATTGRCKSETGDPSDNGNGWQLDAELLLWPEGDGLADTRPRESVTIGTGYFGSSYGIGRIMVHEGRLSVGGVGNASVHFDDAVDLSSAVDAPVYACKGGAAAVKGSALMGFLAQEVRSFVQSNRPEAADAMADDFYNGLVQGRLVEVQVNRSGVEPHSRTFQGTMPADPVRVEVGSPVYFKPGDVVIANDLYSTSPLPFEPVGRVTGISNATLHIELDNECAPSDRPNGLPRIMVPTSPDAFSSARDLVTSTKLVGARAGQEDAMRGASFIAGGGDGGGRLGPQDARPLLLSANDDSKVVLTPVLGDIDLANLNGGTALPVSLLNRGGAEEDEDDDADENEEGGASRGKKVCVVARQAQGRLFHRDFNLSSLAPGERVVMQLAVTGHGWSSTTDQCGEFCHAVYRIRLNGQSAANVTQWRDDCRDNPIGELQYGTWSQSRNGWCPGSVQPGLYVDITDWARSDLNRAIVDVVVWSSKTESYAPYTDYGGFALGDNAKLTVGLSFFVYPEAAVQAIRTQRHAYTAAEFALRDGSSMPSALSPPDRLHLLQSDTPVTLMSSLAGQSPDKVSAAPLAEKFLERDTPFVENLLVDEDSQPEDMSLLQGSQAEAHMRKLSAYEAPRASQGHQRNQAFDHSTSTQAPVAGRYDVEAHAPWYLYDASQDSLGDGVMRVPLFTSRLVQSDSQISRMTLQASALPQSWGQAALRLRLSKPGGDLQIDHWDRECSFGLFLQNSSDHVGLHPSTSPQSSDHFAVNPFGQ